MSDNVVKENEFGRAVIRTVAPNVDVLEITHQCCTASVSLYGGQVLTWQPIGQEPVFWMSESSIFKPGTAIRGGIPLCWPWFGGYSKEGESGGNHGFARTQHWQLGTIEISAQEVVVHINWQGRDIHPLWPAEASLEQTLVFARYFEQSLAMTNLSDESVEYTGALHSYFQVSDPSQLEISPIANIDFDCKLTGEKRIADNKSNGEGPVDRIYYSNADMSICDPGFGRTIKLSTENTHQWVLWNAGTETAKKMADMHQGAENEYVCMEAASTEWQTLVAGEKKVLKQVITIESC